MSTGTEHVERATDLGTVRGTRRGDLEVFHGVPFARPMMRFGPPVPVEPWEGVLDATAYGPKCPQPVAEEAFGLPGLTRGHFDEDCLTVDVHAHATDSPRPVIVWIHGGGFTTGAANHTDAAALARGADAVVVAINYRLGLLGWLDLSDVGAEYEASADAWLADQIAALEWVRDHVGAFGGDSSRVCVVGSSAGAASALALISAPAARGLLHGAVACSPPAFSDRPRPDLLRRIARARRTSRRAAASWVRTAPVEELVGLGQRITPEMTAMGPLYGTQVSDAIAASTEPPPPLIAGFASHESDFFLGGVGTGGTLRKAASAMLWEAMGMVFRRRMAADSADGHRYGRRLRRHTQARGREYADQLITDSFRRTSIDAVLATTRRNGRGYLYEIDLPCKLDGRPLRSTHMVDVPLTFDVFADPDAWDGWTFIDDDAAPALASRWVAMLGHFARYGEPGDALGDWPAYDEDGRRSLLLTSSGPAVCDDRDGPRRRAVWADA